MTQLSEILKEQMSNKEFFDNVKNRLSKEPFFWGNTLDQNLEYIAREMPEKRNRIIQSAEQGIKGEQILPGTGGKLYFVGNPPKWHENPLDNEEYVWELNRMHHWIPLLEAYRITKDNRYAQKVVYELNDWIDNCPCPEIISDLRVANKSFNTVSPWRSLEVGIRMLRSWSMVIEYLKDSEFFTPELLEKFAVSVWEHAEVLAKICPMFWPKADHNHYFTECMGLLFAACLFPEFKKSQEWKAHAIKELERCAFAQITEFGGQIEGCPHYHNLVIHTFCDALLMAKKHKLFFSDACIERIKRGLDYSIHAFRPSGKGVPWGDSDAKSYAVRVAMYGYIVFENSLWLDILFEMLGLERLKKECELYVTDAPDLDKVIMYLTADSSREALEWNTVMWEHELKQVAMRTNWSNEALSIFFACRTPVNNGHAHIDPMSFDFTAYNKPLVVDPGRFTYKESMNRRNFKCAEWHNTLTIDGKSPFELISSWQFGPQKNGDIVRVTNERGLIVAQAVHYNYEPAVHRRLIGIIDDTFLLLIDHVDGIKQDSSVQLYYHLDSEKAIHEVGKNMVHTIDNKVEVALYTTDNLEAQLLPGKVSDAIDISRDSIRVRWEDRQSGQTDRCYATVIIPYKSDGKIPKVEALTSRKEGSNIICTFSVDSKSFDFKWSNEEFIKI